MNSSITFTIHAEPVGKGRPRFVRATGRTYTPDKTVVYENLVRVMALDALKGVECWQTNGNYAISVRAYFPIPESWPKKRKQCAIENKIRPTKKPDLDNILKIICDALNGIVWKDDSMVVFGAIQKHYTETTPRVVVTVDDITDEADVWVRKK